MYKLIFDYYASILFICIPALKIHQSLSEEVTNESYELTGREVKDHINKMSYINYNTSTWNVQKGRSFSRRICKSLSPSQKLILMKELPKYLFHKEKLQETNREMVLEIGFGSGEHLIHQAKERPEILFLGVEAFINGVASVLKLAKEQFVENILIFPNNLDFILNDLPDRRLSHIYILFPDPWPKKKQKNRRLINKNRLQILQTKLNVNGSLIFSTDIDDYFYEIVQLVTEIGNFKIMNKDDYLRPHDSYIITKYHQKAIDAGMQSNTILRAKKLQTQYIIDPTACRSLLRQYLMKKKKG